MAYEYVKSTSVGRVKSDGDAGPCCSATNEGHFVVVFP